ncbi:hypothetical protein GCM10009582_00110 [Arthrobacter flavus]
MLGSRVTVAAVCALAFSLTGCGGPGPEPEGTAIELPDLTTDPPTTDPPTNEPSTPAGDSLTETADPGSSPSSTSPDNSEDNGAASTSMKDCVMVAAGVSSILLAPLSFLGSSDDETVERLHNQIDDVRSMVPPELADDFDRLQEVVTSSTDNGGSFDETSYREAVAPVEEWLHEHCNKPLH